jgi:hypothetical protein
MIRDAVLHLGNEQPLVVDLLERPSPTDTVLVCVNVRTTTGTKPIWIDASASTFVFPLAMIRFLEIHPGSDDSIDAAAETGAGARGGRAADEPEDELELDEDLLRRVREV